MSTQGERLRQAIELAGFTKIAPFAESIGEPAVKVRQHINRDSIPSGMVEKYVRRLSSIGVTTDWLMFNKGKPPKGLKEAKSGTTRLFGEDRPAGASIQITHTVGAGDEIFPVHGDSPLGHVAAPPGYETGGAVAIKGDSGLPAFHDKDLLFYKEWESPPTRARQLPKRAVILELKDGRSYLKKLLLGSKPGRYHLLSINPTTPVIEDVAVNRMARIGWVWVEGSPLAD